MKTFDLSQFKKQLILSRYADNVLKELSTFDRLSKFALQQCENDVDYESLEFLLIDLNEKVESFIKNSVCHEHNENCEGATCPSESN